MSNNEKLKNKFRSFKEILGMGETEENTDDTGIIDIDIQKDEAEKEKEATANLFKKSKQEKKVKEKEKVTDTSAYQSVIIDPKKI